MAGDSGRPRRSGGRVNLADLAGKIDVPGQRDDPAPTPPAPAATPSAVRQTEHDWEPEPASAAPARPDPQPEPNGYPTAPRSSRPASTPASTRRTGRPRQPRDAPRSAPGIPQPPAGYIDSTKPLQVYVDGVDHFHLKVFTTLQDIDMTWVVSRLVAAFNADQQAWYALMRRAEDERVPLAELLSPFLAQALEE